MKHSINRKITLLSSLLLILAIVGCWFANTMLLGNFYIKSKKQAVIKAYNQINNAAKEGSIQSEDFEVLFEQIASRNNLDILILDSDIHIIMSTSKNNKRLSDRLLSFFFGSNDNAEVLYNDDSMRVQRSVDPAMNMEFIELWGILANDNMIVMQSPVESIEESVRLANNFLAYVGAAVLIISIVLANIFSRKITEPILELADISEKVARLDFEAKYDDNGRQDEIAVLGRSINEMSDNLEKTISELKTANNELQADIANKIEIDEMRKEFLSNVSHELKTPIALISGYAEGLKDCVNDDDESRNYYCEVIIDEASKMNTMVQQLLKLNQLESGRDSINFERFNLTELISECLSCVDILIKQNEITVSFDNESPVYVWSDKYKTEQVINNYLSNAIHYAAGEKRIDIKLEIKESVVRLQIFNTGEPIPEEAIDWLWTKFYKVDKARTREYGGTGIGLSIVKAIADSLNRDYGVINYDNGVAFYFDLEKDNGGA